MNLDRLLHAIGVTAIGLIAGTALAHVFELPHKLAMDGPTWLSVQRVLYNGWGRKLLILDLLAIAALGWLGWRSESARRAALTALLLVGIADVVVFLVWIQPTNMAVDNWTGTAPIADWQLLRSRWEWGHTARACLLAAATAVAAFAGSNRDLNIFANPRSKYNETR